MKYFHRNYFFLLIASALNHSTVVTNVYHLSLIHIYMEVLYGSPYRYFKMYFTNNKFYDFCVHMITMCVLILYGFSQSEYFLPMHIFSHLSTNRI